MHTHLHFLFLGAASAFHLIVDIFGRDSRVELAVDLFARETQEFIYFGKQEL